MDAVVNALFVSSGTPLTNRRTRIRRAAMSIGELSPKVARMNSATKFTLGGRALVSSTRLVFYDAALFVDCASATGCVQRG